ncbi:MAG: DUF4912 domain-containing protein [Alkalinema sp. RU_4_3]|nr:DUF4912 domain-containing protein [Alkalinema sp. RU_4_3]
MAEYVISREKIAIIVGADNPFSGDLTFKQFAQMFRGELTDWSKVGGTGTIRFIDRPSSSDTRKSLSTYPVFKEGNFAVGANGKTLDADDTAALIKDLGKDGIGYAIASQALNQAGVKVLSMHKTLPDDPRYPYSQPRNYVYKPGADGNPSPAALAYLGYATSPEGQTAVNEANKTEAAAVAQGAAIAPSPSPSVATSPSPAASAAPAAIAPPSTAPNYANWWLPALLGTAFLGWLASKLLKGGSHPVGTWGETIAPAAAPAKATMPTPVKPVVPTPVTPAAKPVEPIAKPPASTTTTTPTTTTPTTTTPTTTTPTTTTGLGTAAAGLGALGLAGAAAAGVAKASETSTPVPPAIDLHKSWIALTPKTGDEAEAEWHILDSDRAVIPNLPSRETQVRVYDITGGIDLEKQPAHSVQYYNCKPNDSKVSVTLPDGDREYIAAVGYITGDGRWFKMAQSLPLKRL